MVFLIEYDRATGHTLQFITYDDADRGKAEDRRLQIELDLNRQGLLMQREVVLLGAIDEEAVRKTHERYFKHLPQPA
jgi:hypothetical protein